MIFELPVIIVAPMVELNIVYWGAGCQIDVVRFMQMYVMLVLLALSGAGLGLFVGALSSSANQSTALATALTLPILLLSGLAKNLATFPKWWGWLQYLSPSRFALNGMLISQWSNSLFKQVYTEL